MKSNTHHRAAIIGAGFGGLAAAIRLRQRGDTDFVVFERETEVGGTWTVNTYPGAQCDIPSALYSYSFAPNPNWTRLYPLQPEIKRYLHDCASRFNLFGHVRFGEEVIDASWSNDEHKWYLTTNNGEQHTSSVLVVAMGPFSQPAIPEFDGLHTFAGATIHSARWDHEVDLTGKRVAVIGTGASAVQIIPRLQAEVGELVVFQRTPTWIMPHPDRPLGHRMRRLFTRLPATQRVLRAATELVQEVLVPGLVRQPALLKPAAALGRWHLHNQVADPILRAKLTPHYAFGCKRPTFSNTYYPALSAPNVTVETAGIARITATGIETESGDAYDVDAIVLATGFNLAHNEAFARIHGRRGSLADAWAQGDATAHLGTTIAGFPNMFMILGPNSVVYTSQVAIIEAQVGYICSALESMNRSGFISMEVRPEIQQDFVDWVDTELAHSVWNVGGCSSYYLSPGGRNFVFWPGSLASFNRRMRDFDVAEYALEYRATRNVAIGVTETARCE